MTNARLYARSRELSMLSARNRLALDLHDVVSQKLFSDVLTAEAAATLLERDPSAARSRLERTQELAREALDELRRLVLELRPLDLTRDGLAGALRKHVELLRRLHGAEIELRADPAASSCEGDRRDAEVLRIAHEALNNAVRHAAAAHIRVSLAEGDDGVLVLEVADPELRSRHLGLTSMEERAGRLGGRLEICSAAAAGTTVRLEVGHG